MDERDAWETTRSPATMTAALVVSDHGAADAGAAIVALGARLVGHVSWAQAPERIEVQGPLQLIAVDCADVDDAVLATTLPRLDQFARDSEARLVATIDFSQVDVVSASLLGAHADLLCAPSLSERIAAYAAALSHTREDRLFDPACETETVRLRRLNEEIARIAETLTRLSRTESPDPARGRAAGRTEPRTPPPAVDHTPVSARDVRGAIRARRLRDQYFDIGLFEDPAWDILLDLFAAELENVQVSVSSLCIAAAVAPTTALRWITKMTEAGMLARVPDPFDRRRAFMELSPSASEAMRGYLSGLKRAGLAMI